MNIVREIIEESDLILADSAELHTMHGKLHQCLVYRETAGDLLQGVPLALQCSGDEAQFIQGKAYDPCLYLSCQDQVYRLEEDPRSLRCNGFSRF